MTVAQTFATFRRKTDAIRVANRLRDHGIITGTRCSRGINEIFGYVPPKFTLTDMERLALKLFNEKA